MEGKSVVPMEITFMDMEDKYKKNGTVSFTTVHIFKSIEVSNFFLELA
jgi:hypothetical protein